MPVSAGYLTAVSATRTAAGQRLVIAMFLRPSLTKSIDKPRVSTLQANLVMAYAAFPRVNRE